MAYPEINTILRQTVNEVTTIHNSAPTIQTIISKDSPTITTIVNGFWDAVWSVNGQTGDVRIEFTFDEFKPNTVYLKNQAIVRNDNIYIAKNSFTSGSTFNEADWNIIGDMANADMVTYNNTETGIAATTVQEALDYVIGQVPTDFFKLSTTTISGEGNDITLANTAEVPFKNVVLKGDTFQQTYSGKNLLENKNHTRTYLGVTFTVNDDGSITVDGTSQGNAQFYLTTTRVGYQPPSLKLPAGTYTINGIRENGVTFEVNYSVEGVSESKYSIGTFTADAEITAGVYITVANGTTVQNLTIYPQLELGSTATSYEPYVGGIPSPNPDYPQDINVVTGEQVVKFFPNQKNLADPQTFIDWADRTYDLCAKYNWHADADRPKYGEFHGREHVIKFSSTTLYTVREQMTNPTYEEALVIYPNVGQFKENTRYIVSMDIYGTGGLAQPNMRFLYTDGTMSGFTNGTPNSWAHTRQISLAGKTIKAICAAYQAGFSYIDLDTLQIEEGTTETAYEPYVSQTYRIDLGSLELAKIGDYQDYIWTDGEKWWKHKAIGRASFDASSDEDWIRSGQSSSSVFVAALNNMLSGGFVETNDTGATSLNDHFTFSLTATSPAGTWQFNDNDSGGSAYKYLLLRMDASIIATIADFEAWLANNPVTVYYPPATPTDEEIMDATLIAQLEDLRSAYSYKKQTNISVRAIDSNLSFILNVDAFLNTTWEGFQSGVGKLVENVQQDTLKKWDVQDNISDGDDNLVTGGGVYDALREIDNNSAAAHNSIVRGKDLTNIYTTEQLSAKLIAGDFSDIYVGDYITKTVKVGDNTERELDFVIAHIDYFRHVGDVETTRHHLVMVPDTAFYEYMKMNDTNTTTGGYYGSKGHGICNAVYSAGTGGALTNVAADYTTFQATTLGVAEGTFVFTRTSDGWQYDGTVVSTGNLSTYGITYSGTPVVGDVITVSYVPGYLEPYRQAIYTAFGDDHILAHRTQYSTSTSTSAWHTNRCELMNESMVYGQIVRANNVFGELTENSQLAWFSARPDKRVAMRGKGGSRTYAWLSSISSGSAFCYVYGGGVAYTGGASSSFAVRPYFLFA